MGLPPLRPSNVSSFVESDRKQMRFLTQVVGLAGTNGGTTPATAPLRCGPYEVALIDEILLTAQLPDSATNVTCTIQINGSTSGELGATVTRTADPLRFNFPGIADAPGAQTTAGLRRSDRLHLQPRGNMVVRPSSALWVQASVATTIGCQIKYRKKGLLDAIRDGDIKPDGTLPNAASTNSVTTGGTTAGASKLIAYGGTSMATAASTTNGTQLTMISTGLTQADGYWIGKKIRFTSGTNAGLMRVITNWVQSTNTLTWTINVTGNTTVADTFEMLDTDEALEVLGIYLTGHSWNAAADDIRLGYWDSAAGGGFSAGGAMIFRGWAQGFHNMYQPRILIDDTRGCIQGALGSDIYIQPSANLAGATPPADYVVLYRKIKRTEVASTSGTIGATPTVRKKWWCYTQAASGASVDKFFAATVTGDDQVMVKIHGHAWSCTNSDAGASIIGLSVAGGAPISELTVVSGDGDTNTVSNSAARVGLNYPIRKDQEPGFLALDLATAMSNRTQLAWGTFGAGVDTQTRDNGIP